VLSSSQGRKRFQPIIWALAAILLLVTPTNCTKDGDLIQASTTGKHGETRFDNWGLEEQEFFSLAPRSHKTSSATDRSNSKVLYRRVVIEAYNKIAKDNQQRHFVQNIYNKFGLPDWKEALAFTDTLQNKSIVVLPFAKPGGTSTTGLIALTKLTTEPSDSFVIMPIGREELLHVESDYFQLLPYAELLHGYDKKLFDREDDELKTSICNIKSEITQLGEEPNWNTFYSNPTPSPGTPPTCTWRYVAFCRSNDFEWVGGLEKMPIHLDHDRDGIPNWDDVDFSRLAQAYGGPYEDFQRLFEQLVRNQWDQSNLDDSLGDYDDFWSITDPEYDLSVGNEGIDIDDLLDRISGVLDNVLDGLDDIIDNIGDFFSGWFDDGPDCPYWPAQNMNERDEIICTWFHVKDCGYTGPVQSWDHYFEEVVLCPDCPDLFEQAWQHSVEPHLGRDQCRVETQKEYWLKVVRECNPMSPDFKLCIDLAIRQADVVEVFVHQMGMTCEQSLFLLENPKIFDSQNKLLSEYGITADIRDHFHSEIDRMIAEPEYKELVLSSFNWPPFVWTILKELIGDKVVDILANFLGLGQAANVKDAIKGLKNNDWSSFAWNVGQLVVNNTPLGKLMKGLEAGKNLADLIDKVGKIGDKIGHLSEAAVQRIWSIVQRAPASMRFNADYFKYLDDLSVPKLGGGFASAGNYAQKFKDLFPELKDRIGQVHHAVPQAVLNKYPNLNITQQQMHSLENLRGIPNDGSLSHQAITNSWNGFYASHPNATFQQILDKVKEIDDQFGHLFLPPIR
jgi:hypothetical protein